MRSGGWEQGDREVQPGQTQKRGSAGKGAKARRAERRQRARAEAARQLVDRIERVTDDRHGAWSEGDQAFTTARKTYELDELHADKREMRRDIYNAAPDLEGQPVYKGRPGGAA